MNASQTSLRDQVRKLAEEAFHHQLISGYGDGEYPDKFQITYEGRTKHFLLEEARIHLIILLNSGQSCHHLHCA